MSCSDLPSLTALRAFALVVENGSLSAAARNLNVTQPAVTQQVNSLEQFLGKKLLKKNGRGVLLTDEGQILGQHLQQGFAELRKGVAAVRNRKGPTTIRVTTSPSFAAFWLVPRVAAFQAANPGISVQIDLSAETRNIESTEFNVAIRYCLREDLPRGVNPLLNVTLNVLCHRSILPKAQIDVAALKNMPWLQEFGVSVIHDWFARQGISEFAPIQISEMPGNLIIDAIKRAEAVSYTVCDWVEEDIASGEIMEIWGKPEQGCYFAITSDPSPACQAFINWLDNSVREANNSTKLP